MLKSLGIESYLDGYNILTLDCCNAPVAAATGLYNYNNYYFYTFYNSIYMNWVQNSDFLVRINAILKRLGLVLKKNIISNEQDFLPFITQYIDNSIPLILFANYKSIFYTLYNDNTMHGILICGYDNAKSTVLIRDTCVIDKSTSPELFRLIKGSPLFPFPLREDLLVDIWNNRNIFFKEMGSNLYNVLLSIEKEGNALVTNYLELYNDVACNFTIQNDNLILYIIKLKEKFENIYNNFDYEVEFLRRSYQYSLESFFNGIFKAIKITGLTENLNEFEEFSENFIKYRSEVISIIHSSILKRNILCGNKLEDIINNINSNNKTLANYILYWLEIIKNKISLQHLEPKMVDFALNANVIADSEEYIENYFNCNAPQAVNGKWSNWITDMWISKDDDVDHWLLIDLQKPCSICKFVIRHSDIIKEHITQDFVIQGSLDANTWITIINIHQNNEPTNNFQINPCIFRYFRIYITKPGSSDYRARLYEFEVWGSIH